MSAPNQLFFDADRHLYVIDDTTGAYVKAAGSDQLTSLGLERLGGEPSGLALDALTGNLFESTRTKVIDGILVHGPEEAGSPRPVVLAALGANCASMLFRRALLAVLILALPVRATGQPTASPSPGALPPCASIPVQLLEKVDSGSAKAGDRIRFEAIDTVVTGDHTRIERLTPGFGVVEYVAAAGAHGRPGQLLLEARYFALPRGREYQVTVDASASTEIHSGSNGNAPGLAGAIPVPFVGVAVGAFNYFHAGSNVTIPAGYRFAVTPVGDLSKAHRCTPEFQI